MSTTGQDSKSPPVNLATVAAWRRRQEACSEVVSPADSEQYVNGHSLPDPGQVGDPEGEADRANRFHANGHAGSNSAPASVVSEFADSQQAGLAMIMDFAKLETPSQPQTAAKHGGAEFEQSVSSSARAASTASAQSLSAIDEPHVTDQSSVRPKAVIPDQVPSAKSEDGWAAKFFRYIYVPRLSLFIILTIQSVLSLRLVWSNAAFTDEALYLWAGRLEWSHWLHGTPIPPFAAYFSGSPIVYPPIGVLANEIDGLAGARILSLCFMLGATSLLWATANRLYGRRAGLFAAGLWAFLGPTLKLGAFATFDPMSLFLMALSVWCAVRAAGRRDFTRWIVASAAALVLANAAAYSSSIFDPVVVAVALLAGRGEETMKLAKMRAAALAAYTISVLVLLIDAGRGSYWSGISETVLSRTPGVDSATSVFGEAWGWMAPVAVVAAAGLLICAVAERNRQQRGLVIVLAGALLIVPLEQARIHTTTSLDKHTDIGAWFAAIAAGYAVSKLSEVRIPAFESAVVACVAIAALIFPVTRGFAQARELFGWANSRQFVTAFRPLAERANGPLLVENPSPVRYYVGSAVKWQRWSSTWAITLPNGTSIGSSGVTVSGIPGIYVTRIDKGYFALIALNSTTTPTLDNEIVNAMEQSHRYRLVNSVPYDGIGYAGYYAIWERTPSGGAG